MSQILKENRYGKSRVRLVKVTRHADRHDLAELTVHVQLEGDFSDSYTAGDNSRLVATDTMKNVVYVQAKQHPLDPIEGFAMRLVSHFLDEHAHVSSVRVEIARNSWTRLDPFAFQRSGEEQRITRVLGTREGNVIESGLENLVLLKTTRSAFEGYIKDRYTTLKETSDRIFATAVQAGWRYSHTEIDFDSCFEGSRRTLIDTFAAHHSRSVQQTLYAMGEAVLASQPAVSEIHLSLPNRHCLLVDLAPFGLDNPNEIFLPVDEPHGLIEATLARA